MTKRPYEPLTDADFDTAFPSSRKIYVDGPQGVRVPMREIQLADGAGTVRVYDTSGPRGFDVARRAACASRALDPQPRRRRDQRRTRARAGCAPSPDAR